MESSLDDTGSSQKGCSTDRHTSKACAARLEDETTLTGRLKYLATICPEKEGFVFRNGNIRSAFTWKQIYDMSTRFARILRDSGFQSRDVIANTLPNSPERLITDLGILFAGCIPMNGQILLADGEDFFQAAQVSCCKAMVLCPRESQSAWKLMRQYVSGHFERDQLFATINCPSAPTMTSAILVHKDPNTSVGPLMDVLLSENNSKMFEGDMKPTDIVAVFTTSGSTGYSKLVHRDHWWILNHMVPICAPWGKDVPNALYSDRAMGWIGGYPSLTIAQGLKRVLFDSLTEPEKGISRTAMMWDAIVEENCSAVFFTTAEITALWDHVKCTGQFDRRRMIAITGGQPLVKELAKIFFNLFESVNILYGSTEAGLLGSGIITEPDRDDFYAGKPTVGMENVRMMNRDNEECKPGEMGRLYAKGDSIFTGYFNPRDGVDLKTAKAFTSDGWFDVGDNGYIDEKNDLYILGRENDIIMYGNYLVYPGWLERKLATHPQVEQAIVVPVSDPVRFHEICACIVAVKDNTVAEESLRTFAETLFVSNVAEDMTPAPKFYMVLDAFPKNATGKTDRKKIKEMAEARFGKVKQLK